MIEAALQVSRAQRRAMRPGPRRLPGSPGAPQRVPGRRAVARHLRSGRLAALTAWRRRAANRARAGHRVRAARDSKSRPRAAAPKDCRVSVHPPDAAIHRWPYGPRRTCLRPAGSALHPPAQPRSAKASRARGRAPAPRYMPHWLPRGARCRTAHRRAPAAAVSDFVGCARPGPMPALARRRQAPDRWRQPGRPPSSACGRNRRPDTGSASPQMRNAACA